MKVINSLIIMVFALNINLYACYIPCASNATAKSTSTQTSITAAYNELDAQISDSEIAYNKYFESLKEQNKLLEDLIEIRKYNSLEMKKVNFFLAKIITVKDISISVELSKSLKKLNEENFKIKDIK